MEAAEPEVTRFQRAIETSKKEIEQIRDKSVTQLGKDKAAIFESHLLMLDDPELMTATEDTIRKEKVNAEYGFHSAVEHFAEMFEKMEDPYLRERASDLRDLSDRVVRTLMGEKRADLSDVTPGSVIIAHDLAPSDTANLDPTQVSGILTDIGGKNSHTAIIARTFEIPAVLGLGDITKKVQNGEFIVLDGEKGEVILDPDEATINRFKELKKRDEETKAELETYLGQESISLDGQKVALLSNISTPKDVLISQKYDGEGVGLYRTEFLYMNRSVPPTEEEQTLLYKEVLSKLNPKPVVIRTLDIGGDKDISYLKIPHESNPFLGMRAIRYCLKNREIFETQLRALLRASVFGNLKIMFPLITNLEELLEAKAVLESVKDKLKSEGIPFADKIPVGIMVETPAAAVISDTISRHVDFFSIGTNDLTQYVCAVDRVNETVYHLFDSLHPAVLRLIRTVIENGKKAGISVSMCGELAGSPQVIPLLLGMGLTEFSMNPASILRARKVVRSIKLSECKTLVDEVLKQETAQGIRDCLEISS